MLIASTLRKKNSSYVAMMTGLCCVDRCGFIKPFIHLDEQSMLEEALELLRFIGFEVKEFFCVAFSECRLT